jgi:dTDP-4-dehydrorhamnose reductase
LKKAKKKKIVILGGSGFIGGSLYKELSPYYDTRASYCHTTQRESNQHFFQYDMRDDDIVAHLEPYKPDIIISALRGEFAAQVQAHIHLIEYVQANPVRLIFMSSANVFDAYSKFPSYEFDKTLSMSIYGRLKIKIENALLRLPPEKTAILRLPMVFGKGSPRVKEIKQALHEKEPIEVFPNLIVNVTHDDRLSQQVHYIINRDLSGVFHLGSKDLVLHEEFIKDLIQKLGNYHPRLKRVFTTNDDRYLAALPKFNPLPDYLQAEVQDVVDHHQLL